MSGPLSHLRVIELAEGVAGPYCGKLLATYGARVIKVERPGQGDRTRSLGPFVGAEHDNDRESSVPFLWLNMGKESVACDVETPEGRDLVRRLASTADVLIESATPGTWDGSSLSYQDLSAQNARLVVTSVTPFGQTGPYSRYACDEIVSYATGGGMHLTGEPTREPLNAGLPVASYSAGMAAFVGTLTAVFAAGETGRGDHVDVSIQEAMLDNIEIAVMEHLRTGRVAKRRSDHHDLVPWRLLPCRDGWAAVIGGPIRNWLGAIDMFEEPHLADEKLRHVAGRMQHRQEVEALIQPWLDTHDREEILEAGRERGLAFGVLRSPREVMASAQIKARGFFHRIEHPVVGEQLVAGEPFRFLDAPVEPVRAPLLGEHTSRVLIEARDLSRSEPDQARAGASDRSASRMRHAPLAGVRILDLTHDWAGPHATRLLADRGADVLKIEYTGRLDGMRGGHLQDDRFNQHPRFWQLHRNKRSVTLDLKRSDHRARALALVRWADVVVDSSRPGVLERLGLDWDVLRAERADIILVQMSAFGLTGPEASFGGYGGAIEPLSGVQALTGYEPGGHPRRIRELDVTNGIVGACAIMTALVRRQATGQGAHIDLSQTEAAISTIAGDRFLAAAMQVIDPQMTGNRHVTFAPQGCYPCRGEDRWVVLSVRTNGEWQRLCATIGRPEWKEDPMFSNADTRRTHHDAVDEAISAWTKDRGHREAMEELQAAGIPAGAVLDPADIVKDSHLAARRWFLEAEDGSGRYPGAAFHLSLHPVIVHRRGPRLGEHNREVTTGTMQLPDDQVEEINVSELGTAFDIS